MDSIQELFELLQIKSDVWESTREDKQRLSEDSQDWSPCENDGPTIIEVKKEADSIDDDEKEEGEIKDDEDDDGDDSLTQCRSNSPIPVNLSLNTKSSDKDGDTDKESSADVRFI